MVIGKGGSGWVVKVLRLEVPGLNSSKCLFALFLHIFYPTVTVPRLGFALYFYCLQVDSFFPIKGLFSYV